MAYFVHLNKVEFYRKENLTQSLLIDFPEILR